jgi:hypothetical protein
LEGTDFEACVSLGREVRERSNKTVSTSGFFFAGGPRVQIHRPQLGAVSALNSRDVREEPHASAAVCAGIGTSTERSDDWLELANLDDRERGIRGWEKNTRTRRRA